MNNKKLFKGALVLFASILMAVSCQSNSNPDGDDTNAQKPGNQPLPTFKVVVSTDDGKGSSANPIAKSMALPIKSKLSTTDTVLEKDAETTESLAVTFKNADDSSLTITGVTYEITKVERANDAQNEGSKLADSGLTTEDKWSVTSDNKIKLAKNGTTIIGNSDFGTTKYDALKVTLKAKKEGYQDSEFVVYIKATITRD